MKGAFTLAAVIGLVIVLAVLIFSAAYTVNETEQAIITQFGEPVGDPITTPGLHFKIPFIQDVNYIDKRILEWDGAPSEMPDKQKDYIIVNTFARWRISDPLVYFLRLKVENRAQSRLEDILGSETRNTIARHTLTEVVRTTKDRVPTTDETLDKATTGEVGILSPISRGRTLLEQDIYEQSKPKLAEFGIELLDFRFKRINYRETVQEKIFSRMISERLQIAEHFRSEGEGEGARIIGNKERDLKKIESEAYKEVEEIRGKADAKATEIYASAYNQSPEALEFYEFLKTMETYKDILAGDSTIVLSTNSDLFKFLKNVEPPSSSPSPSPPAPRKKASP
ncbi:MAG: protease modulator HflC [Verrucomicrobiota bacterium]